MSGSVRETVCRGRRDQEGPSRCGSWGCGSRYLKASHSLWWGQLSLSCCERGSWRTGRLGEGGRPVSSSPSLPSATVLPSTETSRGSVRERSRITRCLLIAKYANGGRPGPGRPSGQNSDGARALGGPESSWGLGRRCPEGRAARKTPPPPSSWPERLLRGGHGRTPGTGFRLWAASGLPGETRHCPAALGEAPAAQGGAPARMAAPQPECHSCLSKFWFSKSSPSQIQPFWPAWFPRVPTQTHALAMWAEAQALPLPAQAACLIPACSPYLCHALP